MSEWQPIGTAPKGQTVIVWGMGGLRFMRQDDDDFGQWRNMMGAPKQPPTHWMQLPDPPCRVLPSDFVTPRLLTEQEIVALRDDSKKTSAEMARLIKEHVGQP